ncbi:MAG: flavodoxin [Epsilonproteobacteria bacterium]|nr:flavodoxin [Campylobacterota bacterium]
MAIGIFYGSNGGATERVAEIIKSKLDVEVEMHDIANAKAEDFQTYTELIIGTSTWGEGDLQDDWEDFEDDFKEVDFAGKTVAFFGLGDQDGYPDNYLDAMGTLYKYAVDKGANVVGNGWSTEGYDFDESTAIVDNAFVGLALDEDNQDELTEKRIDQWIDSIKSYLN